MLSQLSYAPICICAWALFLPLRDTYHTTTLFICQYLFESFFEFFKKVFEIAKSKKFTASEPLLRHAGQKLLEKEEPPFPSTPPKRTSSQSVSSSKLGRPPFTRKQICHLFFILGNSAPASQSKIKKQGMPKKRFNTFLQKIRAVILSESAKRKTFPYFKSTSSIFACFITQNRKILPLYI